MEWGRARGCLRLPPPALSLLTPRALAQGLWSVRALNCLPDSTAKPRDAFKGFAVKWTRIPLILFTPILAPRYSKANWVREGLCISNTATTLGCARQTDLHLHSTARFRFHNRERELYLRDTSNDLFISELWRLLDDYEIIKPQTFLFTQWPGVKNSENSGKSKQGIEPRKQRIQWRKIKEALNTFLPHCMLWLLITFPDKCDQFIWVRSSQFASLLFLYLKMWRDFKKHQTG